MRYNRSLDGLRGFAVLSVILFHFGYFSAGWIGVQIFFVLSGYLITSILLADRDRPDDLYFKRFYWRRSLRIFPLYFGYLIALSLVFLVSNVPAAFGARWLYLYTYTYNYALLLVPLQQSVSFTHFWSLAVEEQFYLLWPLAVYYLPTSSLKAIIAASLFASPLIRLIAVMAVPWIAPGHPEPGLFSYSPLPAQFDALATGAAISLVNLDRLRRPLLTFGVMTTILLGLGLMSATLSPAGPVDPYAAGSRLASVWELASSLGYPPFVTHGYQHVWSYSVVNLWSALLIVNLLRGGALAGWLSRRSMVYAGKISYGLYVLHYPLLGLVKGAVYYTPFSLEGVAVFGIYLSMLFGAAALSFRYFESRFLAWKDAKFSERAATQGVRIQAKA
jgi:peptidoglycan/LPS O-acetylase OafA/YrhL